MKTKSKRKFMNAKPLLLVTLASLLLAASPVYNFATYEVLPLAEMSGPSAILNKAG